MFIDLPWVLFVPYVQCPLHRFTLRVLLDALQYANIHLFFQTDEHALKYLNIIMYVSTKYNVSNDL